LTTYRNVLHGFFKEPIIRPIKFKLADTAILKIVKSPYGISTKKSSDFDENVKKTAVYTQVNGE